MHKKKQYEIDLTKSKILERADNNFKLMLKEILHINTLKQNTLDTKHAENIKFNFQLNTFITARQIKRAHVKKRGFNDA